MENGRNSYNLIEHQRRLENTDLACRWLVGHAISQLRSPADGLLELWHVLVMGSLIIVKSSQLNLALLWVWVDFIQVPWAWGGLFETFWVFFNLFNEDMILDVYIDPESPSSLQQIMVEVYASHANLTVEDFKLDTGKRALAYTITSLMMG